VDVRSYEHQGRELMLKDPQHAAASSAENASPKALSWQKPQARLFWALRRNALSLRSLGPQDRNTTSRQIIAPVYGAAFTEGSDCRRSRGKMLLDGAWCD